MSIKRDKIFYSRQNRVIDKLAMTHLSPNESKYCWEVFRKTFAFGKYEDVIKRGQMAMLTGMDPTTASKIKKRLVKRNIIHANASMIRFNLNIDQWEKVKVSSLFEKVKVSSPDSEGRADKKGEGIVTLQRNYKVNISKKENFYKKLSGKEIEELEKDQWYKAIMWNIGKFTKDYIERTIKDYPFQTRMNCWYTYQEARYVRSKEPYFSKLLDDFCEER